MIDGLDDNVSAIRQDEDELVIRLLMKGLRGGSRVLEPEIEANLLSCSVMALYQGRRMNFASQDAFDALAAICLVLGKRRATFFENVFLNRMINNPNLTASEKLNRVVEIVIGTIPRPAQRCTNDNSDRELV